MLTGEVKKEWKPGPGLTCLRNRISCQFTGYFQVWDFPCAVVTLLGFWDWGPLGWACWTERLLNRLSIPSSVPLASLEVCFLLSVWLHRSVWIDFTILSCVDYYSHFLAISPYLCLALCYLLSLQQLVSDFSNLTLLFHLKLAVTSTAWLLLVLAGEDHHPVYPLISFLTTLLLGHLALMHNWQAPWKWLLSWPPFYPRAGMSFLASHFSFHWAATDLSSQFNLAFALQRKLLEPIYLECSAHLTLLQHFHPAWGYLTIQLPLPVSPLKARTMYYCHLYFDVYVFCLVQGREEKRSQTRIFILVHCAKAKVLMLFG